MIQVYCTDGALAKDAARHLNACGWPAEVTQKVDARSGLLIVLATDPSEVPDLNGAGSRPLALVEYDLDEWDETKWFLESAAELDRRS